MEEIMHLQQEQTSDEEWCERTCRNGFCVSEVQMSDNDKRTPRGTWPEKKTCFIYHIPYTLDRLITICLELREKVEKELNSYFRVKSIILYMWH